MPCFLVVKYGLEDAAAVGRVDARAVVADRAPRRRPGVRAAVTSIRPPFCVASMALRTRLKTTCTSWSRTPTATGRSARHVGRDRPRLGRPCSTWRCSAPRRRSRATVNRPRSWLAGRLNVDQLADDRLDARQLPADERQLLPRVVVRVAPLEHLHDGRDATSAGCRLRGRCPRPAGRSRPSCPGASAGPASPAARGSARRSGSSSWAWCSRRAAFSGRQPVADALE